MDLARIKSNVAKMASMNAPEADIDGYIASEGTTINDVKNFGQPPAPDQKGFIDNVASDMRERGANLANIVNATDTGQQTGLEGAAQKVGTGFGAVGDILGQGVKSAVKTGYGMLSEDTRQAFEQQQAAAVGSPAGRAELGAMKNVGDAWDQFKANNPRFARDLEAAGNIGMAFMPAGGKSAAGITKDVAKSLITKAAETKAPQVTSKVLDNLAARSYKTAEESGGILKPEITNQFIDDIQKLTPQSEVGKIVTGETPFTQAVQRIAGKLDPKTGEIIGGIRNKPITLEAAQEIDESLADAIDGFYINGKLNKQGQKLLQIQNQFRDTIENAGEDSIVGGKAGFDALKEGRRLWSSSRKMADVERIISRAEMMDNPATGIKTGFRTLYNNPARIRGFTKDERQLIKKAAESGVIADTLRTVAGSRLLPLITGATGGGLGATAVATVGSMASRGMATRLQLNKAVKLANNIANNAVKRPVKVGARTPYLPMAGAQTKAALLAEALNNPNSQQP